MDFPKFQVVFRSGYYRSLDPAIAAAPPAERPSPFPLTREFVARDCCFFLVHVVVVIVSLVVATVFVVAVFVSVCVVVGN